MWTSQAEYYFRQGKYDLAANYFGKTQRGFEEVTLRFISLNESGGRDALKTYLQFDPRYIIAFKTYRYLLQKLDNLKAKDATQRTIICTWLTEMYVVLEKNENVLSNYFFLVM